MSWTAKLILSRPMREMCIRDRSYLTIQKMRYRDQLEFMIDVDQEILQTEIVKLVIQPLVENAIYHGIKYLEHKGMIAVMGGKVGDNIHLIVQDNGVGMEKEVLSHILEPKAQSVKSNRVGVYNVDVYKRQTMWGPRRRLISCLKSFRPLGISERPRTAGSILARM